MEIKLNNSENAQSSVVVFDCSVRGLKVQHTKFYHFFSRGCCSTYSYLYMSFCEKEEECKQLGIYERCPLLKELVEEK